jgi:hypothetical protein
MKRRLIIIGLALAFTRQASAADYVCNGILTDQRSVGISLGNCDLNSLSDADLKRVTAACGQPNGVDEDSNKTVCYVRAVTVPKTNFHGIRSVTKLLGVAAERP